VTALTEYSQAVRFVALAGDELKKHVAVIDLLDALRYRDRIDFRLSRRSRH
jgi:hypothetical protein